MDEFVLEEQPKPADMIPPTHYYGDIVRKFFMAGGFVLLVTLPFLYSQWPFSFYFWIVAVFAIIVFAGVTNPNLKTVAITDGLIASSGFLFFGYYTIYAFETKGTGSLFFWVAEILAILFFFALYFAIKTVRGMLLHNRK